VFSSEANQEKIVEAGGLGSLLSLLQSSEDETIRRVAAGAVANLAMNGNTPSLSLSPSIFSSSGFTVLLVSSVPALYAQPGL